ncbi:MAG: hypothetical protein D6733_00635 [Methanobacteriota archaeon]|nr:MAG: hypothetical protein D6733_00635 [Euryarchaeota archaeon]
MSSFEIHIKKHRMFLRDAENESNSEPTRIEAYFESAFHLIEAVAAQKRIHINKHQLVRNVLEENHDLFREDTQVIWRAFQELENQIRPGQVYGGAIDGEALEQARELVKVIQNVCKKFLDDTV